MKYLLRMIAATGLIVPILLCAQATKKTSEQVPHKVKIASAKGDSLVPGEIDVIRGRTSQNVKVFRKVNNSLVAGEFDVVTGARDAKAQQSKTQVPADFVPYDQAPEAISQVQPKYPQLALKAGLEGTVWVKVWIDESGKVVQTSVQKTDAEIFNQSAIDAAMQWTFKPAVTKGKPVATWVSIPFRFKIQGYPLETRTQESMGKTILTDRSNIGWQESLIFVAVVLLFVVIQISLVLIALVDIVKSRFPEPNDKVVWTIIVAVLPVIGPILYFVVGRKQKMLPT